MLEIQSIALKVLCSKMCSVYFTRSDFLLLAWPVILTALPVFQMNLKKC